MKRIQFFEKVFDEEFCKFLLANARAQLEGGTEFGRSSYHWEPSVRKSSAVVLVRDYHPVLSKLILERMMDRGMIEHAEYEVMNFAWTRLSYLPWHNDRKKEEALTIYLNDKWELDWGGLFLYKDEEEQIRAYAPKFNCGLRNDNNILHATTLIGLDAPEPRFTLQIFSKPRV
jgi:hypothetical protein